jgi:hypothetical protein
VTTQLQFIIIIIIRQHKHFDATLHLIRCILLYPLVCRLQVTVSFLTYSNGCAFLLVFGLLMFDMWVLLYCLEFMR